MSKLQARFFNHVDKNGPIHPIHGKCWQWKGTLFSKGYGRLCGVGYAHRISWMIHVGEIPSGLCVCHKCDNPSCVNPDHLFLGTNADNMKDKVDKGRSSRCLGEHHGRSKLTDADVLAIRSLYLEGSREFGLSSLAEIFGISTSTTNRIVKRKIWNHI